MEMYSSLSYNVSYNINLYNSFNLGTDEQAKRFDMKIFLRLFKSEKNNFLSFFMHKKQIKF